MFELNYRFVCLCQQEVNKSVRSILNKITPENKEILTKRLLALPISTFERIEKVIHLIFEKVIYYIIKENIDLDKMI